MSAEVLGPTPVSGGAKEIFLHERASAAPRGIPRPATQVAPSGSTEPVPMPLREVQLWFANAILSEPAEPAADGDAKREREAQRVVRPGPRMSASDALAIYQDGYRARLVECLADDYPALNFFLGDEAFATLARAYIAKHPSCSPNLNAYGRHMAAFCQEIDVGVFEAELAQLEWALVEVLHAGESRRHGSEAASVLEALQAVPMEQWEATRLPPSGTVRLLRFTHPVNRVYQEWRQDKLPLRPGPESSATAVYRRELTLWRMDLTPPMAHLLERLFAGDTLGEALAGVELATSSPEALAAAERNVMVWFREWVAGGLFAKVIVP